MTTRITSKSNPNAKHFRRLGTDPDYRRERGEFLCEGENLLSEALAENAMITGLMAGPSAPASLVCAAEARGVSVFEADDALIRFCATVVTPQSVLFSVGIPEARPPAPGGKYLILDAVRDPGNVGTILRSADAFGTDAVVMTSDCADIYAPKTVRSTMGAIFRQAVRVFKREAVREEFAALSVPVYGASAEPGADDIFKADLSACAVVIGNEAHGLSPEIRAHCSGFVKIPMVGRAESLNASVAAGIAAFLMSISKPLVK